MTQYTQSLFTRNDLAPCEQEQVGPGLNIGPEIPASGGFQDFTRVLPNNVNNYKANQLEGRVTGGKWAVGGEPTAYPGVGSGKMGENEPYGVPKNKPDKFYSQVRRPTMTTKVGYVNNQELLRPDYRSSFKPGNAKRSQTNYGFGEAVVKGTEKAAANFYAKQDKEFNSVPLEQFL